MCELVQRFGFSFLQVLEPVPGNTSGVPSESVALHLAHFEIRSTILYLPFLVAPALIAHGKFRPALGFNHFNVVRTDSIALDKLLLFAVPFYLRLPALLRRARCFIGC